MTDPRGLMTSYAHDGLDDVTSLSSPDTGVTAKTYDAAGNPVSSTDARGNTTTYTYDALNRVTKAAFADSTSIIYQYDQGANGIGHLTTMTDAGGTTTWVYDVHGQCDVKAANDRRGHADHKPNLQCGHRAARQHHLSVGIDDLLFL